MQTYNFEPNIFPFITVEPGTSKPLLKDLICLKVTPTKWYPLGLHLNISEIELDKIRANHSADVDTCILEMFKTWLRNTPDASYTELNDALDRIGEHSAATQLLQPSGRHMRERDSCNVVSIHVGVLKYNYTFPI